MKLFYHPQSSSARRVTMTIAQLARAVDYQLIDLLDPSDRAALRAINPNNKVPVLVDGDLVLWESHAIMQYLCAITPDQTLYPTEARARADVDRWMCWVASHLGSSIGPINFERMWKKLVTGGEPDLALIARHEGFVHQCAAVLDAHLADRAWVAGRALTLADISIAATLMYKDATELPLGRYANLLRYLDRVSVLPTWQSTASARMQ